MRTEEAVASELAEARRAYHEEAGSLAADESRARSAAIKALMAELSDTISAGADPCPGCGNPPHGSQKTPATEKAPAKYQILCLHCGPEVADEGDSEVVVEPRAFGWSAEGAVAKWNAGKRETKRRPKVGA